MLREDNADLRLTECGRNLGLVDDARWRSFSDKQEAIEREQQRLRSTWVQPSAVSKTDCERVLGQALAREYSLMDLLRRPQVSYDDLMTLPGAGPGAQDPKVAEQVEVQAKYRGYIERQETEIARARLHEETALPESLDYADVRGLSAEVVQKLSAQRPPTLGHAARISGVTPVAISLLLVHLKKRAHGAVLAQKRA